MDDKLLSQFCVYSIILVHLSGGKEATLEELLKDEPQPVKRSNSSQFQPPAKKPRVTRARDLGPMTPPPGPSSSPVDFSPAIKIDKRNLR